MPRDPKVSIEDILEAIRRIRSYTANMDGTSFSSSPITVDAVVRNLEIIGEAAARIPDGTKAAAADVEWRKIVALRNVLAHEYFGVNTAILWDVVANKLGTLERACREMLGPGGR